MTDVAAPLYIRPDDPQWDAVLVARPTLVVLPDVALAETESGSGEWRQLLDRLHAVGIMALGYVRTGTGDYPGPVVYGARPLADVLAEVDRWKRALWWLDGILLDEVPASPDQRWVQAIHGRIRAWDWFRVKHPFTQRRGLRWQPAGLPWFNAGWCPDLRRVRAAPGSIWTWAETGPSSLLDALANLPPRAGGLGDQLAVLVHSCAPDLHDWVHDMARAHHVRWSYATPGVLPSPWSTWGGA